MLHYVSNGNKVLSSSYHVNKDIYMLHLRESLNVMCGQAFINTHVHEGQPSVVLLVALDNAQHAQLWQSHFVFVYECHNNE